MSKTNPNDARLAQLAFADRKDAGRQLAARLLAGRAQSSRGLDRGQAPPVVLALPRGGVPVAFEIAIALHCPLDVLVARKIGAPGNPELGIGAVAEGGVTVLSEEVLRGLHIDVSELQRCAAKAQIEMRARVSLYRRDGERIPLTGRIAILVDDGLATGGTARAAVRAARAFGAAEVLLAAPVGAPGTICELRKDADEVICPLEPEPMWAIGMWYRDFRQVSDEEVLSLLAQTRESGGSDSMTTGA
jgi:putative phosphoribosyl transferase